MFGYIQDAKTLGTIFINGIAYTLCTAVSSFQAQIELNGEIIKPNFKFGVKDGVLTYPGLRYGQSCDIIFNIKDKKVKDDTKLKVTIACVHKGQLLCPDVRYIEI